MTQFIELIDLEGNKVIENVKNIKTVEPLSNGRIRIWWEDIEEGSDYVNTYSEIRSKLLNE